MDERASLVGVAIPLYRPDPTHLAELLEQLVESSLIGSLVFTDDDPKYSVDAGIEALIDTCPVPAVYLANDEPLGMVGNWNAAVSHCRARFVVLHCQDDRVMPEAFDELIEAMICEELDVAVGAYRSFAPYGWLPTRLRFGDGSAERHTEDFRTVVHQSLLHGNVYGYPSSTVFRKRVWEEVGGYRERYEHMADLDFLIRATAHAGELLVEPRPVSARRVHRTNLTQSHVASGATTRDRQRLWDDFAGQLTTPRARRRAQAMMSAHATYDACRHLRARRGSLAGGAARAAVSSGLRGFGQWPWAAGALLADRRGAAR